MFTGRRADLGLLLLLAGMPTALVLTPADPVRWTVDVALAFWLAAVAFMLTLPPPDWAGTTRRGWWARCLWTLGAGWFVVHVLVAYALAFGWSHTAALAHTQARSGFGPGIYLSHAFTLGWCADVVWWWNWPTHYAHRPVWIGRGLHGFMLFLIVNGAIVYETGPIRYVAAFALLALAAWAWRTANVRHADF